MPNIDAIQPVYYDASYPYYVYYDNLPLRNIVTRQELINSAVDRQWDILNESIGSAGTLANRLAASLNPDGSLKTEAIDDTMHSIAYHTDGSYDDGVSVINYVRMQSGERAKLSLVADSATSLALQVNTPSSIVLFEDETVELISSSTVTWGVVAPNQIAAHLTFASDSLHNHLYDQTPVHDNLIEPDYQTYKINSLATPFISGSLRVYINGMRLSETGYVYAPSASGPTEDWTLLSYTPDAENGMFTLSTNITSIDVIRIDYDTQID